VDFVLSPENHQTWHRQLPSEDISKEIYANFLATGERLPNHLSAFLKQETLPKNARWWAHQRDLVEKKIYGNAEFGQYNLNNRLRYSITLQCCFPFLKGSFNLPEPNGQGTARPPTNGHNRFYLIQNSLDEFETAPDLRLQMLRQTETDLAWANEIGLSSTARGSLCQAFLGNDVGPGAGPLAG
jgi:hypothetical protein